MFGPWFLKQRGRGDVRSPRRDVQLLLVPKSATQLGESRISLPEAVGVMDRGFLRANRVYRGLVIRGATIELLAFRIFFPTRVSDATTPTSTIGIVHLYVFTITRLRDWPTLTHSRRFEVDGKYRPSPAYVGF